MATIRLRSISTVDLAANDQSGGINIQTVRHEEGKVIYCLKKHTSAVSVLQLGNDEQSVLSGGWDRQVHVSPPTSAITISSNDYNRNGI